ncbi:MAG: hypothetical protein QXS29_09675 [Nitrososphaeria archaeon]
MKRYCGEIINMDIDLMIYAQSVLSGIFEIVPVEGNNIPSYTTWITPEITVTRMSAHGVPPSQVKFMSAAQYFPSFYMLSTPRIYQPRSSILTGETGPNEKINARARYEIAQALEDDMWTLLANSVGAFGSDVWAYDTRIQSVPSTNFYDFSEEGGLTKGLFQKILAAVDLIPSRTRPNESARIRNIFVPHVAVKDIREWVSVVSNTVGAEATITPDLQREIERRGPMIESLWGETLGLRKVNRLMGTTPADFGKFLWVFLDEPVGRLYLKTDEDRTDVLTDRIPYEIGYVISRVVAMEIPEPYKPNFMLVQFAE